MQFQIKYAVEIFEQLGYLVSIAKERKRMMTIKEANLEAFILERLAQRPAVEMLVRNLLGCKCPDEVFDSIAVKAPAANDMSSGYFDIELIVGGRLLVGLVYVDRLSDIRTEGRQLIDLGTALRDQKGLNRFRLVLVGEVLQRDTEDLELHAAALDDKVHIHVISAQTLDKCVKVGP